MTFETSYLNLFHRKPKLLIIYIQSKRKNFITVIHKYFKTKKGNLFKFFQYFKFLDKRKKVQEK